MILNEYLNYICENNQFDVELILESFNEDKTLKSYKKNLDASSKFLKDHGVSTQSIVSISNKFKSKIKNMMDKGISPGDASKEISKDVSKEIIGVIKKLNNMNQMFQ